jgi:hypothetical protein
MDVDGFIEADAEGLKGTVLPRRKDITEEEIPGLVQELSGTALWELYKDSDGNLYAKEPRWTEMQQLRKDREAASIAAGKQLTRVNSGSGTGVVQADSGRTPAEVRLGKYKLGKDSAERQKSDSLKDFFENYPDIHQLVNELRKEKIWNPGSTLGEMLRDAPSIPPEVVKAALLQIVKMKPKDPYPYFKKVLTDEVEKDLRRNREEQWEQEKTKDKSEAPEALRNILAKLETGRTGG